MIDLHITKGRRGGAKEGRVDGRHLEFPFYRRLVRSNDRSNDDDDGENTLVFGRTQK